MRITSIDSYFCFGYHGLLTEPIMKFCLERVCSECIVGEIKREFCGSSLVIDVNLGCDLGLDGEEEI